MFLELKVISKRAFLGLLVVPLLCAILLCMVIILRGDSYKVDYTLIVGGRYNAITSIIKKDSLFLQIAEEVKIPYAVLRNSINYALDQRNQAIIIVVNHSSQKTAEKIAKLLYKKLKDPNLISQDSQQQINAVIQYKANYQLLINKIKPINVVDKKLVAQISDLAAINAATNAFVLLNNDDYIDEFYRASKLFVDSAVKVNENNMVEQVSNSTQSIIKELSQEYNFSYEMLNDFYEYYFYNSMIKYADERLIQLENLQKIQSNLMLGSLSAYHQKVSIKKSFILAYIFVLAVCVFGLFVRRVMQSSKEY